MKLNNTICLNFYSDPHFSNKVLYLSRYARNRERTPVTVEMLATAEESEWMHSFSVPPATWQVR
jgi:hypothetical protein